MAVPQGYVSISVYLPPEVAKFVTEYAEQKKLTRRSKEGFTKPALATAVVSLLKSRIEIDKQPKSLLTAEDIVSLGQSIAKEINSTNSIS
jgi:hypothetical protein